MSTVTLDSIRAAVEAKYASYDIELGEGKVVKLQNAIRLSKDARAKIIALQGQMKEEGADQVALLSDSIRAVAHDKKLADELVKATGGDLAILVEIFTGYGKATQLGEASASHE